MSETEEVNSDLLNILIGFLPKGIILTELWGYKFEDVFAVQLKDNVNVSIYKFTWNSGGSEIYISKEVMQEKFDILNLHKKLLNKYRVNLSQEEITYLYNYYKFMEKL
jgi:hypothetical protein